MTHAPQFKRKNIRLPANRYHGHNPYFLTLCFSGRRRFGSNPRFASWLVRSLQKNAVACGFFVHAYCIMPDHTHVLATASSDQSNVVKFVESFKQETAIAFARRTGRRLWQFKYYDRVLRSTDSPESVAWYIWLNPVRKGFCQKPADYPFLGSFTEVGARMLKGSARAEWTPPWKKENTITPTASGFKV